MAYRRSLTTRAKFLYQQKGAAPAICYTHDDDRKTYDLHSCENPRVSSFFQTRYARSEINSFNGSKNPFQNRRFFPSHLMIPMNSGSMFTRSMSSSVGGGAEKIEYISEVAELADKAVEAVASQVPAVNEVANAAADSYLPVKALQYLIDYVHIFTGFDWWASIIATTIVIRCITLPLMINQLKATTKFAILKPKLDEINEEMQSRGMAPAAVAEGQQRMQAAMKEHGVTPFTPLKGILIQGPVFVSFFMAISNMVEKVPSFKQGGVLWFTDLTVTDSMYIFPVLTALTFWITVECNAQEGLEGNPSAKTIKNVSRAFAALTIPFTAGFPKVCFIIKYGFSPMSMQDATGLSTTLKHLLLISSSIDVILMCCCIFVNDIVDVISQMQMLLLEPQWTSLEVVNRHGFIKKSSFYPWSCYLKKKPI
ncbi:mitochondrial inner membrane protein OXA1-like isoform X2 [Solanum pennellii]|uniref:Mitochondrial inner membrane protein OXA1-like isoform X2 n=1 Tax=Solanum pennellii TaxID=28526 RepID=A0ABM1HCY9_SOLPN|nr:mitochondrial inner membrane protein OXA1-like isoform X2 [Solanum pennellii]